MSQRPSGSAGPGSGDWPDDLWPDDDDRPGGGHPGGAPGGPRTASPRPPGRPEEAPPARRVRPVLLLVIALLAAAAGIGIVLAAGELAGSSGATPGAAGQPSALTPVAPGGNSQPGGGALPGTGSGGTGTLFLIGKVTAVSSTSITVGGPGHTVTAAVTRSTRITGKVSGISGIKVGDQVSAQIVHNDGAARAIAIQDPAQPPAGGTAP
jgi:hypothetical protein